MKINWTKRNTASTVVGILITAFAILFYFFVANINFFLEITGAFFAMLNPFILGVVVAYLLATPLNAIEKLLSKLTKQKMSKKAVRMVSILFTYLLVAVIIVGYISIILPQLISSVTNLLSSAPSYIEQLNKSAFTLINEMPMTPKVIQTLNSYWQTILEKATDIFSNTFMYLFNASVGFTVQVANFIVAIVVSIYFLSEKERFVAQFKKSMYGFFPNKIVEGGLGIGSMANSVFHRYISGQLLDAVVVGILCFVLMTILNIPYALLVSTIVMSTNVIPMVGPFIGAIPSTFIILMVDPLKALWFVVMIFVLQQIDGNILVPKIVGDSTGLSAFWVLFSIFIGGGLFGILGIVLAVPTFSILYALFKSLVEVLLERKSLSIDTGDYLSRAEQE